MAGATIAVMITGSLSTKDILLDLVAIAFFAEADNKLAPMFLSNVQLNSVQNLVESFRGNNRHNVLTLSRWSSGMMLLIVMVMTICLVNIEEIILIPPFGHPCTNIELMLIGIFILLLPGITCLSTSLIHFVFDTKTYESNLARQVCSVYEYCLSAGAGMYSVLVLFVALGFSFNWAIVKQTMLSVGIIYLVNALVSEFLWRCINDRKILESVGDDWVKKLTIRMVMIISIILLWLAYFITSEFVIL